mmetsp:Transcript_69306/g.163014  ORF Transcript_69306/g.163014 Transcript_69306/m.163014 type:complete len:181 (+) Transcript_69306:196-738(+)
MKRSSPDSLGFRTVGDTPFNLQIWDTAGQERFRSMVRIYYRGASAAILVFDVTDKASFTKLKEWVNGAPKPTSCPQFPSSELHGVLGEDIVLAIACNKMDLAARREVSAQQVQEYARTIRATVHETSAKTKEGVDELFMDVARRLLDSLPEKAGGGDVGGGGSTVKLEEPAGGNSKGCPC